MRDDATDGSPDQAVGDDLEGADPVAHDAAADLFALFTEWADDLDSIYDDL